ncbi:MAG: c-type cytochrome [Burkholderiales bacterium]
MNDSIKVLLVVALLLSPAVSNARGSAAAGKEKSLACQACHGADGNSASPEFPKLAGQLEDYITKALTDYKSGARQNPIMAGFAATLSEQDIHDLAAYFSSQQGLRTKY